ncbi:MAG: hypothetical protein JW779_06020 [Candidatus Thorarchaeota archaeon]|nr:hypothetical protein [Candidatus Thorarchaeota archaeon]
MALREDSEPYCLAWVGFLLMGAYYANFGYQLWTNPVAVSAFINNSPSMLILLGLPPLMVFLFTGYLRPSRGKAKMSMLGPSVIAGLFFVIISYQVGSTTTILGDLIVFSAWGIGSALLTAGGFSIMASLEKNTSPGIMDISSLHYGPVKETPAPTEESVPQGSDVKPAESAQ